MILPGETYARVDGLWDGTFHAYKTCSNCEDLKDVVDQAEEGCYCIPFGGLLEYVQDYYLNYDEASIAKVQACLDKIKSAGGQL